MKRAKTAAVLAAVLAISGCGTGAKEEYTFTNAGFERGTLSGWTAEGNAFTEDCVSVKTKTADGNYYYKEGEFFLYGGGAPGRATGSLTSETFKLKGNGKIGFLLGAGADTDKCYVALVDKKGNELARRGNEEFGLADFTDSMHRVILDGSKYAGKEVAIKIVDNDNGNEGYNYINVDDFIVNYQGGEEQVSKTRAADKYIEENAPKVNPRYRHTYHAMPPVGWMNDPNGFGYAFGKYQLFYQFHPYSSAWGPMHWGHYTSSDLVKWELMPTALAPDAPFDRDGCFSGTSIVADDKQYLMYTSVADGKQTQALAVSSDGVSYEKIGRVISSEQLPAGASVADFRDPKVFVRDGRYYAVIGSKTGQMGHLLLYRSDNLRIWSLVGTVYKDNRTNGIYECPDLVTLGGKDILITSPQGFATDDWRHENLHSNLYMVGSLSTSTGAFTPEFEDEIDSGMDFYAPQTLTAPDGRVIMTAWMQMWSRSLPTQGDGWAGAMILPRELTLVGNKLYQRPVREIEAYRQNHVSVSGREVTGEITLDGVDGVTADLELTLNLGDADVAGVKIYKGGDRETRIYYDRAADRIYFDRRNSGTRITGDAKETSADLRAVKAEVRDNKIKLRILLDVSSAEVFIGDGERAMTGNVYARPGDTGISFFAEGGSARIESLDFYDLVV